ncbi:MAG TPA: OB-fold domain-containing protein [Candidatus Thermoplasmatota archaeon]|nr:OB-fold domain-containing protein [Candidatus Thermoplasmatota archaeon]
MEPAILGAGLAAGKLRISADEMRRAWGHLRPRGLATKSACAWDEDAATLAVEASARALEASGADPEEIGLVAVATSGHEAASAVVAEALGLRYARLLDVGGRRTAGLAALVAAFDSARAVERPMLAVAVDVPRAAPGDPAEQAEGAGAAAFVVGPGAGARLAAAGSAAREVLGGRILDAAGVARSPDLDDVPHGLFEDALAVLGPLPPIDALVASPVGTTLPGPGGKPLAARHTLESAERRLGDLGAAQAPFDLALALADAEPGHRLVAAARDAGAVTIVHLEAVTRAAVAGVKAVADGGRPASVHQALMERGAFAAGAAIPEEPLGAYIPPATYTRDLPARYRLEASRCGACGRLAYPPPAACPACGGRAFARERLAGRAVVETFTVIGRGGSPGEFAPEQAFAGEYPVAVVRFEEGPRVTARLADVETGRIAIGLEVEPALRRLYRQQGAWRYGLKFVPTS